MSMLRLLRLLPGGPDQAAAGILAALMLADAAALAGSLGLLTPWVRARRSARLFSALKPG